MTKIVMAKSILDAWSLGLHDDGLSDSSHSSHPHRQPPQGCHSSLMGHQYLDCNYLHTWLSPSLACKLPEAYKLWYILAPDHKSLLNKKKIKCFFTDDLLTEGI